MISDDDDDDDDNDDDFKNWRIFFFFFFCKIHRNHNEKDGNDDYIMNEWMNDTCIYAYIHTYIDT